MCSCEDGEQPVICEKRWVKSKRSREHRCCECRRAIPGGSWLEETNGLWGVSWDRFRTCQRCAIRRDAWTRIECQPTFGSLVESVTGCLGPFVARYTPWGFTGGHRDEWRKFFAAVKQVRHETRGTIRGIEQAQFARRSNAAKLREVKQSNLRGAKPRGM